MNVIDRLDEARAQTNVLEHPFYERWSAGELGAPELALYAGEYRHAVLALAEASARAAGAAEEPGHRAGLQRHAEEEAAHVELWDEFARATRARVPDAVSAADAVPPVGGDRRDERPLVQTETCAQAWAAGDDLLERLAVLYAIEASQPEISRTKLRGLIEHYGYTPDAPALEYFRLHEHLDVEHAHAAGELIGRLLEGRPDAGAKRELMVQRAREALSGNWLLLDGVLAATPNAVTAATGAAGAGSHATSTAAVSAAATA